MNKKKIIFRLLLIWVFVQIALWITGISKRDGSVFAYAYEYEADPADKFFPFDGSIIHYDITELFIYGGIPLIAYVLFRFRRH